MSGPSPAVVRARLEGGALADLADLALDHALSRSVLALCPPSLVARHLAAALRDAAALPGGQGHLRAALARALDPAAAPEGGLGAWLAPEVTRTLEALLAVPTVPEPALVSRLLDHDAMRSLVQEVLTETLVAFARRMRSLVPDPARVPGLGRSTVGQGLSRLKALGSGMVAAVGGELEQHLEQRARDFVAQGIRAALQHVARLLTDPDRAPTLADWRVHGLRVLLDTERSAWREEAGKADPDRVAGILWAGLQAVAARPTLEADLAAALAAALAPLADRTLGDLLGDAGLRETWRAGARDLFLAQAQDLVEDPVFQDWLARLVAPGPA